MRKYDGGLAKIAREQGSEARARTQEEAGSALRSLFSTICERSPLSRREANRWSGGSRGRHSGGLR
jgi:hypothetical protein